MEEPWRKLKDREGDPSHANPGLLPTRAKADGAAATQSAARPHHSHARRSIGRRRLSRGLSWLCDDAGDCCCGSATLAAFHGGRNGTREALEKAKSTWASREGLMANFEAESKRWWQGACQCLLRRQKKR